MFPMSEPVSRFGCGLQHACYTIVRAYQSRSPANGAYLARRWKALRDFRGVLSPGAHRQPVRFLVNRVSHFG